jgi:hypothetical protein
LCSGSDNANLRKLFTSLRNVLKGLALRFSRFGLAPVSSRNWPTLDFANLEELAAEWAKQVEVENTQLENKWSV